MEMLFLYMPRPSFIVFYFVCLLDFNGGDPGGASSIFVPEPP